MSRRTRIVVAAIDATDADAAVLSTARALASLLRAEVEAVHVLEDGGERARTDAAGADIRFTAVHGHPVAAAIKLRAQNANAVALVVGGHAEPDRSHLAGHVALRLITELDKPVVLAPPAATTTRDIRRLLVPLDGARATAEALSDMIEAALEAVVEVTLLHVHEPAELPLFTEQPQHERPIWSREFIIRSHLQPERVQLELRVGAPEEHLLDVADQVGADLIVLGWRQDLAEGHATVVREAVARARIPVMLLPISAGSSSP